jgi:hypothetical protein
MPATEKVIESDMVEPPAPLTAEQVQALVANSVADALAGAVPAMMAEMMKGSVATQPGIPSPSVHISQAPSVEVKADYLKKYRLDNTVSGKFQMLNMERLDGRDIDELDAAELNAVIMKGKWFHFVNDCAFAISDNDIRFVEEYLIPRGTRVYEDEEGVKYPCSVEGCGRFFSTEKGLTNHMAATHGVGERSA